MKDTPIFTEQEKASQETFTALMMALSYPGEQEPLSSGSVISIGQTLLDLETTFYTSDRQLAKQLAQTTAREVAAENADYLFFPTMSDADLEIIKTAKVGTMLYPDRSATLIIGCNFGDGVSLKLTGPGIKTHKEIQIGSIPEQLFSVRGITIDYPLGWDIFFVDGSSVMGLPRTTVVDLKAEVL